MLKKLKNALRFSSLAASVFAATMSAPSLSVAAVASFAENAINTGILAPSLLAGITINSQVTYPTVFVFPAENQQWFTTIRTCFNPQTALGLINLEIPVASTLTTLGQGLGLTLSGVGSLTGLITGTLGPVLNTGAAGLTNLTSLLTGTINTVFGAAATIFSTTPVAITYQFYNDAGQQIGSTFNTTIAPNGCDTHTTDVNTDPLLQNIPAGVYSVVVTAPALQGPNILTAPILGFLTGTSNSTGRNVLKAVNILKD